jgi:hypothetical protein
MLNSDALSSSMSWSDRVAVGRVYGDHIRIIRSNGLGVGILPFQ